MTVEINAALGKWKLWRLRVNGELDLRVLIKSPAALEILVVTLLGFFQHLVCLNFSS